MRHFSFLCRLYYLLAPGARRCCHTIFGPLDVARVMQLKGDDERLQVVARRLDVSPSVVSRLWRSYQETEEYTGRQDQYRSRMTIPRHTCVIVLEGRLTLGYLCRMNTCLVDSDVPLNPLGLL